jgi:hypothetical protein
LRGKRIEIPEAITHYSLVRTDFSEGVSSMTATLLGTQQFRVEGASRGPDTREKAGTACRARIGSDPLVTPNDAYPVG